MPDRQPFQRVGRAFRLTPLPSQNASKESPPKVLKLKTSFESTRRINILKSVNSSVDLSGGGAQNP